MASTTCRSLVAALVLSAAVQAAPFAYVADQGSTNVLMIDTATNTVVATVNVGAATSAVAGNAAGTRVYTSDSGIGTVSVVDTSTNTVVATVPVGNTPYGLAVNPAGT